MKKRTFNKLSLSKTIIGKLYGGITDDDDDDEEGGRPEKSYRGSCEVDRSIGIGCPTWVIPC